MAKNSYPKKKPAPKTAETLVIGRSEITRDWSDLEPKILRFRKYGFGLKKIARGVGIPVSTLQSHLETDEVFRIAYEMASTNLEARLCDDVADAGVWQASMVMLKALWPQRYSENRVIPSSPTTVQFVGDPDAGMPRTHPMAASDDEE